MQSRPTKQPTLFLDRDGVINQYRHNTYIRNWDEFVFCENAISAIQLARRYFKYIIVVTNQQGVGKGLMQQSDLDDIHRQMLSILETNHAKIDAVYSCTMLKSKSKNCRKPNHAMALLAKEKYPDIDFMYAYMIGDSPSDMLFGKSLGMRTAYVFNPFKPVKCADADIYCEDLKEGMDKITAEL